jgi:LuxR family maltose regulon positive regulatory protein
MLGGGERQAGAAPRLIPRGELVAALDRAAEARVTLISAPAGGGKSSLLRAWADGPGRAHRLAVVQVQRDQQDAQQFWLAVLGAVRQASGKPGDAEHLAATPDFNEAAIADRILTGTATARSSSSTTSTS